jgi:hypothetical protein
MKTQFKIIGSFLIVIVASFIGDLFHDLLGDTLCIGRFYNATHLGSGCNYYLAEHAPTWHYGFKHWILVLMSVTLFIYNIVTMINKAENEK